jgi:hypothetical protein
MLLTLPFCSSYHFHSVSTPALPPLYHGLPHIAWSTQSLPSAYVHRAIDSRRALARSVREGIGRAAPAGKWKNQSKCRYEGPERTRGTCPGASRHHTPSTRTQAPAQLCARASAGCAKAVSSLCTARCM